MAQNRLMVFVTQPGVVDLREQPIPDLGSEDVLIQVKASSICGSDLHIYKGKHPAVNLPVPIGHEISGIIEKKGTGVNHLSVGDRVAVEPVIACGDCHFCQRGDYHLCQNISFQYRQGQGGFTQYFIVHQRWTHSLPEEISFAEGALIEPLSVAVHAARKSGMIPGGTCAIFGAGAIGLLLLQVLRSMGCTQSFVIDIQQHRLDVAQSLGATYTIHNQNQDAVSYILEKTGGLGVDVAFEAVGIQPTLHQALHAVRKGGNTVLVGLFEQPEISLPANIFVQKEITLTGSQGYAWDFQRAIALVQNHQIELQPLITHRFHLNQIRDAFQVLLDPQHKAIKAIIEFD